MRCRLLILCPVLLGVLLVCLTGAFCTAAATTIHVDWNGGGDFLTIQEGIDAASAGDTVLVAPGFYTGPENRNLDYGGTELVLIGEGGPAATVVDCQHLGRGFIFQSGEGADAILAGVHVTNGSDDAGGGGIYCVGSSPTIVDCVLSGNETIAHGAGMYCDGGDPTITDVMFNYNHASTSGYGHGGGGMYCGNASPEITGCDFTGNSASSGGGLYIIDAGSPAVTDCTFESNSAVNYHGGGAFCYLDTRPVFTRCTFDSNTSDRRGGGVLCQGDGAVFDDCEFVHNVSGGTWGGGGAHLIGGTTTFKDCAFRRNTAHAGGGIYLTEGASPVVSGCDFIVNSATGSNGGGLASGDGSTPVVMHSIFQGNIADRSGGGIYCYSGSIEIENTVFSLNRAATGGSGDGGGLSCGLATADVRGATFWANEADYGGGISVEVASVSILSTTFCGNSAQTTGSGVCFVSSSGTIERTIFAFGGGGGPVACVDSDPTTTRSCVFGNAGGDSLCGTFYDNMFVDPKFCDGAAGDLTLHADSPCLPWNNPWNEYVGAWGCQHGDSVVVGPGTFRGEGNTNVDFLGKSIRVLSQVGRESTIIDCEYQGRGFVFSSGEDSLSTLRGFTITRALADTGGASRATTPRGAERSTAISEARRSWSTARSRITGRRSTGAPCGRDPRRPRSPGAPLRGTAPADGAAVSSAPTAER